MNTPATTWKWRVWRAFEDRHNEVSPALARGLARSCRGPDGRVDLDDLERWFDVYDNNERGIA